MKNEHDHLDLLDGARSFMYMLTKSLYHLFYLPNEKEKKEKHSDSE